MFLVWSVSLAPSKYLKPSCVTRRVTYGVPSRCEGGKIVEGLSAETRFKKVFQEGVLRRGGGQGGEQFRGSKSTNHTGPVHGVRRTPGQRGVFDGRPLRPSAPLAAPARNTPPAIRKRGFPTQIESTQPVRCAAQPENLRRSNWVRYPEHQVGYNGVKNLEEKDLWSVKLPHHRIVGWVLRGEETIRGQGFE